MAFGYVSTLTYTLVALFSVLTLTRVGPRPRGRDWAVVATWVAVLSASLVFALVQTERARVCRCPPTTCVSRTQ